MPAKKAAAPKKAATKKATVKATETTSTVAKQGVKKDATSSKPRSGKSILEGTSNFAPYVEKKDEEYMSHEMAEHFRAILNDWKKELMEEVDRTMHHMQDEAANFPDPNDRASQESEFAMELRARDRERKLLKKIAEALDLIDEGEYGFCEGCGVEIGIRRLEARPTATLCIDCKTLDEIREKQRV